MDEAQVKLIMDGYLNSKRSKGAFKEELDIGYRLNFPEVILHTLIPRWGHPDQFLEVKIARAYYKNQKDVWEVFWFLPDGTSYPYQYQPEVFSLREFLHLVDKDRDGSFWGK
jgi:hypothetical protein